MNRATFAARAHEGIEGTFSRLAGVLGTRLGFLAGTDGQLLEVVEVRYNPDEISFVELLEVYWHPSEPPASLRGTTTAGAARFIVFYHDNDQRGEAQAAKIRLERNDSKSNSLTTEILPVTAWLDAPGRVPPVPPQVRPAEGRPGED